MISAISTNQYALSHSMAKMENISANIASDHHLQNVEKNVVELSQIHHEVKVQSVSLQTADSMMGALIDVGSNVNIRV